EAVNKGQIYVKLTPKSTRRRTQQQLEADLRKALPRFQGVTARIMELGAAGRSQAPIQLNLEGPDLGRLQQMSDHTLAAIRDVSGLVDLAPASRAGSPSSP